MNLDLREINLTSLCVGCLSENRKLIILPDGETKLLFYSFLDDFDPPPPLRLCFECLATLKRAVKFKEQVRNVQKEFSILLKNNTKPKCLSKLSLYKNDTVISYHFDSNDIPVSNTTSFKQHKNDDIICKTNDVSKNDRIDPVYVKEENDVEGIFLNDDFEDNDDYKNDIKIEDDNIDNFQESDDEPLSIVKKKKKRKKRKNKEDSKHKDPEYRVVNSTCVQRKLRQLNIANGVIEMIVLSWRQVEAERVVTLQSPTYVNLQYRCSDCVVGFNHKTKLEQHNQKHKPEAGDIICTVCKIRFKNNKSLYAHKRRHRVRWRCCTCLYVCSRASVCADHAYKLHHAAAPVHTCTLCGETTTTLGKLKLHMRSHTDPVSCEICGKTYANKDTLRTHLFIHKGEKEYECSKCDKKFLFKKALEIHKLTHEGNKFLYCHQCDVTFKNHLSFYQHMKYNLKHIDPNAVKHPCPTCGRVFGRMSRLREHMQTHAHTHNTDIFVCTFQGCQKKFSSRVYLRSHTNAVHRTTNTHTHVCHTCGHRYKSKKSLESHLLSHSGERPLHCDVAGCTSTFVHSAALYRHRKLVHHLIPTRNKTNKQTIIEDTRTVEQLPSEN